jgi:hypothetical protein
MSDDDAIFDTSDEAIAAAIEQIVDDFNVWARDHGAGERHIFRAQKMLRQELESQRETMAVLLEARCTAVH